MVGRPGSVVFRYGLAIIAVALATGVRSLLDPVLDGQFIYSFFLLSVLVTASVAGRGPALVSVGLGALAVDYVLLPPHGSPQLDSTAHYVGLSLFVATGSGIALLSGTMHAAQRALRTSNATLETRVQERTEELSQALDSLRDAEERFSVAMACSHTGCWELDLENLAAYRSPEHARIFGYESSEGAWGMETFLGHVLPEDRAAVEQQIRDAIASGARWDFECRIRRADGEERWVWVSAGQQRDAAGGRRIAGIIQDVTARKQTEQNLIDRERLLGIVTDNARVGLVVVGTGYRYLFANEAYAEIFGLTPGAIVGKRVPEVLTAAWPQIQPRLDRALAGERVEYELTTPVEGGVPRHFAVTYEPQRGEGGGRSVVVVVVDITERKLAEDSLRESQAKLEAALASMTDAVFISDTDGHFIHFNDAFATFHRFRDKSECARHLSSYPEIIDVFLENGEPAPLEMWAVPRALRGETVANAEYTIRRKDSGETWKGSYSLGPIRDSAGRIVGSVVVGRDVTERKRVEEVIQASEERFRQLAENIREVFWLNDPLNNRILYVSPAYESVWGRTCEALYASSDEWLESIHPEDRGRVLDASENQEMVGTYDVEYRIVRPDGGVRWIHDRGFPVRDESGAVYRIAGVAEDITERREAERASQLQQARLEGIVNSAMDGIITVDEEHRIVLMNNAAERMFGCAAESALGQRVERFIPERYRGGHAEHIRQFGETGVAARSMGRFGPISGLRSNGEEFPIEASISQIEIEGHKLFTVTCRDVTERIRAEETRQNLEAQLHQSQKMEAFGQLAGGVAHDFNNLLTVISGYTEWLLSNMPPDVEYRRMIDEVHAAGERAAALTRQLLAFSRQQVIEPKVLNLNASVEGTEKLLRRIIGEDIQLSTALQPDVHPVRVDPGQIEQVIINLAVNARDAMPRGGKLTIETGNVELDASYTGLHTQARQGSFVLLGISDTGTGMDAEVKARIFEPFFTTKGVGKGTGLGLAVVHGIVKQSGGSIEVYSEPGAGTSFKIYLPALPDEVPCSKISVREDVPRGSETILLVEDETAVRELSALALRGFGYTVLAAQHAEEAFEMEAGHTGRIDLLVTDVVMPEMSGPQLAEILLRRYPSLKVLFVSGYTDDAVVRHGVLQAEVAFLQKPFALKALARKVREVLDR